MVGKIYEYLAARRAQPRDDVLTQLATATFGDGTLPDLQDVVMLGAFLFGAGQDTTARLLGNSFRKIAENAHLQATLRSDPARIGAFIEESLRHEGSVKSGARICIRSITIGGVDIKAGDVLLFSHLAANRDPQRFPDPARFDMDRPRNAEHLAFGRGPHTCIGAQLARLETRISIEQLLGRLGDIRVSDAHHGPQDDRSFHYDQSYVLRAISALHIEFG